MNEHIKQLAEQANELDYETFDEYNHKTVQHYKFNKEKFAELIVRECALTAGLMEHEGRKGIGAQILDNFGVKE